MNQRTVRLIVNPRSGHRPTPAQLGAAARWLTARGWRVEQRVTRGAGHARQLAAEAAAAGCDVVLVCGGDGTINEVVNAIAGTRTALAVIPSGTVNVWAREVEIPFPTMAAVALLETGERRLVDLGRAGERYFLLLASAGTDSEAVRAVTADRKRRWGRSIYVVEAVRDLLQHGGRLMTIEADGERIVGRVLLAVVGNSRLYGGVFNATYHARLDDGLLDLCIYTGSGWWELAKHIARTIVRRHDRHKRVVYRQARRIRIHSADPIAVQADGEHIGETSISFDAVPNALLVVIPRGLASPLFRPLRYPYVDGGRR